MSGPIDDPAPCALVDLDGGEPRGYAVLKDLVGATQFLLIPTERVEGIESPQIVAADAPNYFAAAWRARSFVEQRAGRALPRDWIGLAINSAASRTQNSCTSTSTACVPMCAKRWPHMPATSERPGRRSRHAGRSAVSGDRGDGSELDEVNPFEMLADGLAPATPWARRRWSWSGAPAPTGGRASLLAGRADARDPGSGSGEDLQDHASCPPPQR